MNLREPLSNIIDSLHRQNDGRNAYHLIIGEDKGQIVGGAIVSYLADAAAGAIEFIVVHHEWRGRGFGSTLHGQIIEILGDDARRSGSELDLVLAEVEDPYRSAFLTEEDLDPFHRLRIWHRWGYRKLAFPYIQPALAADRDASDNLLLLVRLPADDSSQSLSPDRVDRAVYEYIRLAMRRSDPCVVPEYQGMATYLKSLTQVPLIGLTKYVADDDPLEEFRCVEVAGSTDPRFDNVMQLYEAHFKGSPMGIGRDEFQKQLVFATRSGVGYHLLAALAIPEKYAVGMTSFFSFGRVGFGGYLVVAKSWRQRGLARHLIRCMERTLVADDRHVEGWLIECEPGSQQEKIFFRIGFRLVDLPYTQPVIQNFFDEPGTRQPLHLLYKPLGDVYPPPVRDPELRREVFLEALSAIMTYVYRISDPILDSGYCNTISALGSRQTVPLIFMKV